MKDAAGKTIKAGQLVDVSLLGMYHAVVVEVHESPVMVGPNRMQAPQAVIQILIPLAADPRDQIDCYIVRDAEEKPKLVTH